MTSIDIYEMRYRDIQLSGNIEPNEPDMDMNTWLETNISRDTEKEVNKVINDINFTNAEKRIKLSFSKATYTILPQINLENNTITLNGYIPISTEKNENFTPKEVLDKFKLFDVEKLPLIDVAKLIGVEVEKSNQIKEYGFYSYRDRKIVLGTDNLQTFLHELAHAILDYIDDDTEDVNFKEQVAELSAVAIAKYFKLPCNIHYTAYYLEDYPVADCDKIEVNKRVKKILEFVKQAKAHIERQQNK